MLVRAIARLGPAEERVIQVLADRLDHPDRDCFAGTMGPATPRRAEQATPQILGVMRGRAASI